jgi:Kef-type K+ transport system membrane component KefB
VLVLLFEIGLHTDLRSLVGVGSVAGTVGLVGVALPFVLGYFTASFFGLDLLPAVVAGAALTATSIGISARVLSDLGALQTREGQVVIGAAVLDDVVGLIILSIVSALAGGAMVTPLGVGRTTGIAIGFIVAALLIGRLLVPPIFRVVEQIKVSGSLGLIALAFAFFLAWLADISGSAMIIGAFAAGLVLHGTPQRHEIERATTTIGFFFVPIFFAAVGAQVDLGALANPRALAIGGALIAVAVLGKFAAGFAPFWFSGNKTLIGVAMIPRGEVGLIFAQMGLTTGALDAELFSAVMLMVMVTTFMAPVLLGRIVRRAEEDVEAQPGDGGIDDLVAGSSQHDERRSGRERREPAGPQDAPR